MPRFSNRCSCCCCANALSASAAHVGDAQGTHSLPFITQNARWAGSYTMPFQTYSFIPLVGTCQTDIVKVATISIILIPNCTTKTWTLQFGWQITICRDPVSGLNIHLPAGDSFGGAGDNISATIPMDCSDTSLLTFNIATTHPTWGYANPMGGGLISCTFG